MKPTRWNVHRFSLAGAIAGGLIALLKAPLDDLVFMAGYVTGGIASGAILAGLVATIRNLGVKD